MIPAAIYLPALWLLWAMIAHRLIRNPRTEPIAGLTMMAIRAYARWFHRMRIIGAEHVPADMHAGPLIIVGNHTAGLDPLLVQAAAPFEIKWMMARDMMPAWLSPIWAFTGVIAVNRAGADMTAARQALRYLAEGDEHTPRGVIGIFPEGGIERPTHTILPFQPGVGLLIHKSGAPVLQVIIDGTPQTPTAWGSLFQRSTRVVTLRFLPMKDYRGSGLGAGAIAEDLRERLRLETGWRLATERSAATQR